MSVNSPEIWIITGASETGKTRFCAHLIEKARRKGLEITGLLSPPVYMNGVKTAIEVEDLCSGERKILARRRIDDRGNIQTKRWSFDTEVLNWGNDILAVTAPCDLLVVDELGVLEFEHGGGWQNGLSAIQSGKFRMAIVVIRPDLIDKAIGLFKKATVMQIPLQLDGSREMEMQEMILKEAISYHSPKNHL